MFPFDLATLFLLAGLLVGVVAGNAALYGDTLMLHIATPPKLVQTGFDGATAEQIFIAESAWIVLGESIVAAPTPRVSSRPTVIGALAAPLQLTQMVGALQEQFGYQRLVVNATVLAGAGDSLRMLIVVEQPGRIPEQIQLTRPDGDAPSLIRRGAALTMALVSPYRVAEANYLRGLDHDPDSLRLARETADRYLDRPWDPARASERAMLHNLLAMMALLDDDRPAAEASLALVALIPGVSSDALGVVALNQAFLAIADRRPKDAAALFALGQADASAIALPDFQRQVTLLGALVAWANGDTATAEAAFRRAIAEQPGDDIPHTYLSHLLAARGDGPQALVERSNALARRPFAGPSSVLALSVFRVDPVAGGLRRR